MVPVYKLMQTLIKEDKSQDFIKMEERIYVADTSVVIEGLVSRFVKSKKIAGKIIIPKAVMAELENQANTGQEIGFLGLEELQTLQKLSKDGKIGLDFIGERPNTYQIAYAKRGGEIDAVIRDIAYSEGAVLITADKVQSESAKALGIEVMYCAHKELTEKLDFEKYFDENTMSIHLREDCPPRAKKGRPGEWILSDVDDKLFTQADIQRMAKEIVERSRLEPNAFIEISRPGSTIVQYKNYRIVITKTPVSDGWEITAVKPIKSLKIEEYNLPEKVFDRVKKAARGVLVAGETGSGKCLEVDTPIYSENLGKIRIKNIIEKCYLNENEKEYIPMEDLRLLGINKDGKISSNKVKKIVLRKESSLMSLETASGKGIKATKEHPFLIFRKDEGIKWIYLKDIKAGDLIASPEKLLFKEKEQELDILRKLNQETVYALCKIDEELPIYMKYKLFSSERKFLEEIFYKNLDNFALDDIKINSRKHRSHIALKLIKQGVIEKVKNSFRIVNKKHRFTGEFWLSLKDLNSKYLIKKINKNDVLCLKNIGKNLSESITIKPVWSMSVELTKILAYLNSEGITKFGISNTSKEILDDFFYSIKKVFGTERTEFKEYNNSYYIDGAGIFYTFFKDLLHYDFYLKQKSSKIKHPEFFLNLTNEEKKAYLRAYFDAESSVGEGGIELLSASFVGINQISNLLLNFGIHSRISKKTSYARNSPNPKIRDYYRLTISGRDNLIGFKDEIGFLLGYKEERLNLIIKDRGVTNVGALPAHDILKKIKSLINGFDFRLYSYSCYSKQQLKKILPIIYERYTEQFNVVEKTKELMARLVYFSNWKDQLSGLKEVLGNRKITISKFAIKNNFDRECMTNWINFKTQPRINKICRIASKTSSFYLMPYSQMDGFDSDFREVLDTLKIQNKELSEHSSISAQEWGYFKNNSYSRARPDYFLGIPRILSKRLSNLDKAEELISEVYFLANSEIFWDKVKSINNIKGNFEVFDVEVEDCHNFIAGENPVISHNSTISSALAEHYASQNFITKTVESPRDLVLSSNITQYSKNLATGEEIHDILFLSRPDYIIFDEMRDTPDFKLFTDLRLGGSNVLGVLHAATPIDAVQRFIGRIDVGMIPSVLDTILFIQKGNVGKIMTVQMTVKVPTGMIEADLARPVIEVHDYMSDKLEFEIYSYGEETVVIPISETQSQTNPLNALAEKQLERELREFASEVKVKIVGSNKAEVYIPSEEISRFIGSQGKNIDKIEKKVGFGLTVKELQESSGSEDKTSVRYDVEESRKALVFRLPVKYAGAIAEIYVDNHFLLMYTVGKSGEIKVNKKSKLGDELLRDLDKKRNVEVRI